jgi:serine phosphatase RsbU (regulator of sigma subunit)
MTYVLAGQERPFLLREGQPIRTLSGRGRFLGMIDPLELHEYMIQLYPGDKILLYSDGAVDAENWEHEQFGYDRLVNLLEENRKCTVQELMTAVASEITGWSNNATPFDDLTLVAFEVV